MKTASYRQSGEGKMPTEVAVEERCGGCNRELPSWTGIGNGVPCPKCGATTRKTCVSISDTVELHDDTAFKLKSKGVKKPIVEGKSGDDLTIKTGRWAARTRLIDREQNRYIERIVDKNTGDVLRDVDEPLTDHVCHGSAKGK
jgi:hypothetical protein